MGYFSSPRIFNIFAVLISKFKSLLITSQQSLSRLLVDTFIISCSVCILTLSAKLNFPQPFSPVPLTMQTFVVMLIGLTYGFYLATTTFFFYLLIGALGLPVFANGGGIMYLLTAPTAGFLYGMFLATMIMSWLSDRSLNKNWCTTLFLCGIGQVCFFTVGLGWLSFYFTISGHADFLQDGFHKAIAKTFTRENTWIIITTHPEFLKTILAVVTLPHVKTLVTHIRKKSSFGSF